MAFSVRSRSLGASRPNAESHYKQAAVCRPSHAAAAVSSRRIACHASKAKFFVGGNWKSNGTTTSIATLIKDLNAGDIPSDIEVVCAPPFVYLDMAKNGLDSSKYTVAAQNMSLTGPGAYTGEIAGEMLADLSIPWVILGHSERRSLYGENNEVVGKKCAKALSLGLNIIPCIGETLEQRNAGNMFSILDAQLNAIVANVNDWCRVVVAYEPVWAIGTGVVATPAQAQEVHAYLRKWFTEKLGKDTAEKLRIIYGGSVSDSNCNELALQPDVDGFLVGGASLKGPAFVKICQSAKLSVSA